jgi:radical SAM protein with 4Fe4S-binding SPASM domain
MPSLIHSVDGPLREKLQTSGALARMSLGGDSRLRPFMLIVETINICNSECVFCPYTIQTRPKGLMTDALFERTLQQYLEMGGGTISLTPMVGDMLLDRKLPQRMQALRSFASRLTPSVTTNLYALKHWSDDIVVEMLNTFRRVHVSCYGITEEENYAITKRRHHATLCHEMRRLLRLKRENQAAAEIVIGFRTLYEYGPEQIAEFQVNSFGEALGPAGVTATYCNWGNTMRGHLPGHARWVADRENHTPCVLLAIALQVYHDGRVSACSCCDFDASPELTLGNLSDSTLVELFNSEKSSQLWRAHQSGEMPNICRNCTFHSPMSDLAPGHLALSNVMDFIGG